MANDQPISCVQAKTRPPEWLPSTCATPPPLVVSLLLNRFPLAISAHVCGGRTLSLHFNRSPKFNATIPANRSQFTQETAEPYEFWFIRLKDARD